MRFLTSVDSDLDYRNALAERATAVGDKFLEGDAPVLYSGVPLQPIPLFPENLGPSSTAPSSSCATRRTSTSASGGRSASSPRREISEGTLKIVATLRFDVKFAEEPGAAKAINVKV